MIHQEFCNDYRDDHRNEMRQYGNETSKTSQILKQVKQANKKQTSTKHLNEEIQKIQETQSRWPIDESQGFNTKSRESRSSLMSELLTKCDCDTLEDIRDPNNTPICEVSVMDAALDR